MLLYTAKVKCIYSVGSMFIAEYKKRQTMMKDSDILVLPYLKNSQETLSRWDKIYSTMGQGSSMEGTTDFTEQEENTDPTFAYNYLAMLQGKFHFRENSTRTFT